VRHASRRLVFLDGFGRFLSRRRIERMLGGEP
jgi:hypothetical protein